MRFHNKCLGFAAVATLAVSITDQLPAAMVFMSESPFGAGAAASNPMVFKNPGDVFDFHIYFVPAAGDNPYVSISLDVSSSNVATAAITGSSVPLFDILIPGAGGLDIGDRWSGVSAGTVSPGLVDNMTGVAVGVAGLDIANNGAGGPFTPTDEGYDATANAFYFGSVTVAVGGAGVSHLNLGVGAAGIVRNGDVPRPGSPQASIFFGSPEATARLGDDFGLFGTTADATVTVIPEPSAFTLLGVIVCLTLGWKRLFASWQQWNATIVTNEEQRLFCNSASKRAGYISMDHIVLIIALVLCGCTAASCGAVGCSPADLGDLNGDGFFNGFDIAPFVLGLIDPADFTTQYPSVDLVCAGDFNSDNTVNGFDITPFVNGLLSTPQIAALPAAAELSSAEITPSEKLLILREISTVPEPGGPMALLVEIAFFLPTIRASESQAVRHAACAS